MTGRAQSASAKSIGNRRVFRHTNLIGAVLGFCLDEDFGGYCVIRASKSEPRRKMPCEIARNYIVQEFRNEARGEVQRNFETVLLNKHHFVLGRTAGRASRPNHVDATLFRQYN